MKCTAMHHMYIVRRTQISLDEDQDRRPARRAADSAARRSRFQTTLAELRDRPIALEDGATYIERLRARDAERQEELERRRQ